MQLWVLRKVSGRFVCLLIILLFIFSCSKNNPFEPEVPVQQEILTSNGTVEGTIRIMNCFFEYQPVVGVLVKIEGTALTNTTSSNGFYRIEQVPEGNNILIASNNYTFIPMPANITRNIVVKNEETTYCNIDLPYVEGIFPP